MKTSKFYRLAAKTLQGLNQLGVPLGLTHVAKAIYEPVYLDAKARAQAFAQARQAKSAGYAALRARREEAGAFLLAVRDYLTAFLGNTWSPAWAPLGFPTPTLQLPATDADRCSVLEKFELYFASHPEHENAAKEFTAVKAQAVCAALGESLATVDACKEDARAKRNARAAAEALLEHKHTCLQSELESLLSPTDPRWLRFLDRIPGDLRVPEKVQTVTATAQPGGIIALDWPDTVRAARYKVLRQVVGTDAEFVVVETVDDSAAEVIGLPAGATVKLQVVPLNEIGEGAPSDVIELQAA